MWRCLYDDDDDRTDAAADVDECNDDGYGDNTNTKVGDFSDYLLSVEVASLRDYKGVFPGIHTAILI